MLGRFDGEVYYKAKFGYTLKGSISGAQRTHQSHWGGSILREKISYTRRKKRSGINDVSRTRQSNEGHSYSAGKSDTPLPSRTRPGRETGQVKFWNSTSTTCGFQDCDPIGSGKCAQCGGTGQNFTGNACAICRATGRCRSCGGTGIVDSGVGGIISDWIARFFGPQ
jgi:hypothetical protein